MLSPIEVLSQAVAARRRVPANGANQTLAVSRIMAMLGVMFLLTAWYLVRYLYRSMKTVYGQSAVLTFAKFCALGFAYLLCGFCMVLATAFYSAATL